MTKGSEQLFQLLSASSKTLESKLAIIEAHTGNEISYSKLLDAMSRVEQLFESAPQKILLALPGGIIDSVVWLTALTFGYQLIPVSPSLTEYEFDDALGKHNPDIVIADSEFIPKKSIAKVYTANDIEKAIENKEPSDPHPQPTDGSVYLETSGSTGTPKGMILTATQIVITASHIQDVHKITEHDRGLTPLPFHHVNAPVVSLVTSMLAQSTLIIAPKFSASNFWSWVEQYQPTWISIVPTIVAILLTTDRPDFLDHSTLRFIRTASAPLPKANLIKFEEKFGIPLIETYGISEAASTITANPLPPEVHKPGSAGKPIGVQMEIREKGTKKQTETGTIGEVWVQGPQVISSYIGNADAESFDTNWFRTGDLGYFDNDGYLFITGRSKEMIIRGGENIAPREIEEVLVTHPDVHEVAVVGQPDPIYGEEVVAYVVPSVSDIKLSHSLKLFIQQKLSVQKVPTKIHVVDALPRGKTGKIDKQALKKHQL